MLGGRYSPQTLRTISRVCEPNKPLISTYNLHILLSINLRGEGASAHLVKVVKMSVQCVKRSATGNLAPQHANQRKSSSNNQLKMQRIYCDKIGN